MESRNREAISVGVGNNQQTNTHTEKTQDIDKIGKNRDEQRSNEERIGHHRLEVGNNGDSRAENKNIVVDDKSRDVVALDDNGDFNRNKEAVNKNSTNDKVQRKSEIHLKKEKINAEDELNKGFDLSLTNEKLSRKSRQNKDEKTINKPINRNGSGDNGQTTNNRNGGQGGGDGPVSRDIVTWKVPDGGYGWVIVTSALIISLIVDGLTYTFGVILSDLEDAFQEPKSKISLASSIQVGLYLFIGPVVSAMTNRFGCRPVIIAGSLVASAAFIISTWSNNVTMLILTYGVIGGIGFGLMYLPAIVAVSIYFEERRALATGIAVCGSGIGTFILAPLTDYLLYEYNWSWTIFILGAFILNGIVFGALVRPLELQRKVIKESSLQEIQLDSSVLQEKAKLAQVFSSSTKPQEEVPLISDTEDLNNKPVVVSVTPQTNNADIPRAFFSSTPNMIINSASQSGKTSLKDGSHKSPVGFVFTDGSASRARSNTLDIVHGSRIRDTFKSDKPVVNTPPRAHAPIGLAFISLSDADLDKIREDAHISLSRKDIHLSGPLPFPESESIKPREDKGQTLYVQSLKSITSLSVKDGLKVESKGFWSCLPSSARETLEQMLSLSILKDKRYWCVLMGNFFCMIGFYVPFVYVPDRAKQLGIEEDKAAFLLSIIGITNTIGRVLTGLVINFLNIDCVLVTTLALALAGIMTAVCPFCETYPALAGISAVFGVCVAAYISLCSVLLCELLGVENLTNAFGFVILFRGVACIMGPPMAGAIFDSTGVYDPSFYIGGIMIVLGAVSHALLMIPCCRQQKEPPSSRA